MKNIFVFVISLVLFSNKAMRAQSLQTQTETWFQTFSTVRISNQWGVAGDFGTRRVGQFVNEYFQGLARVGAVRHFGANNLTLGYAFFETEGRIEHRLYQFLMLPQSFGIVQLRHRYRFEQRWRERNSELDFAFNYRFGYQIAIQIPLIGKTLAPKIPFALFQNELFVNFGSSVIKNNIFDQNRILLGIGYQFSKVITINGGYQYVYAQRAASETFEQIHSIRLNLIVSFDLRKPESEPISK